MDIRSRRIAVGAALLVALLLVLALGGAAGARPAGPAAEAPPVFLRSWGGEGDFVRRAGDLIVVRRPELTIITANSILNRITLFNVAGNTFTNWGRLGDQPGQFFNDPGGIAMDGAERIYVTDRGPNVHVFDLRGGLLDTLSIPGADPLTTSFLDVAVAGNKVYVAAGGESPLHVHVFSLAGDYLGGWGPTGDGEGQIRNAFGLAIDETRGWLYVVDSPRDRIVKFTLSGVFLKQWGTEGGGLGQFARPFHAAVDDDGRVYVTDLDNDNLQVFDSEGNFLVRFTGGNGGSLLNPRGIFVAEKAPGASYGAIYITDDSYVRRYRGDFFFDNDPATDPYDRRWGREPLEFIRAQSILYGRDDRLYAADRSVPDDGHYVGHVYDRYGTLLSMWDLGELVVTGMSQDAAGAVYVAGPGQNRIAKYSFDASLTATRLWFKGGTAGSTNEQFNWPTDIANDAAGNIYVADRNNHRVQVLDSNGGYLRTIASPGSGPGQFLLPVSLAFDDDGNLYLFELGGLRVQKFAPDGTFLREWGGEGVGEGQFTRPLTTPLFTFPSLTVQGNAVYVTDPAAYRVQAFDREGTFVTAWGTRGPGVGEFEPDMDVTAAPDGDIYVASYGNSRIQVFNFIRPPEDPVSRLVINGNMEADPPLTGWANSLARGQILGTTRQPGSVPGRGGSHVMRLGQPVAVAPQGQKVAWASQVVYVDPSLTWPVLSFNYNIRTNTTVDWSDFYVAIQDATGVHPLTEVLRDGYRGASNPAPGTSLGWRNGGYNLSAFRGQTIRIVFMNRNLHQTSLGIWTELDNVRIFDAQTVFNPMIAKP